MKVLVLAGGTSNERDVSLRSGAAVADALKKSGHEVYLADPKDNLDLAESTKDTGVVFIALHGEGGEDGSVQSELERLGIPYTGSNSQASALCFDKSAYKKLLLANNLPASSGQIVSEADIYSDAFQRPYVLKPIKGGSSLDMQIVRNPDKASLHTANDLLKKYPRMLLEQLVEGVEITVGVLDDEALPVTEIIPPKGAEFDYENKYNGATEEICPPLHVSESKQREAKLLAESIHKLAGCSQISRTDMIIDKSGKIHVLETNTIPGFTDQSLYPKMAAEYGISMPELADRLVTSAAKTS